MSEQIDGGLAFKATLDINDFNVSSEAMERRIKNVSDQTVVESARMEQSIQSFAQNGAKYIVSYLVGNGMMSLANSIVQTRGQFQQLEIAFETMLGSASKSKILMDQLTNTAAKTPFGLQDVAGGAKQLLAYGSSADKVNDTLIRLGNIASGLSIPLNDIIYLYGTSMVQGRLYAQDVRQFTGRGIPLVKELAAMYGKSTDEINGMVSAGKIGFNDVEKVINKMTNSGGQFYNLMEKQSKSLTGMISNLGDAWDMALNKIGTDNQDVFASGIEGATYLVGHMDDILRILKSVTIAYGSYKAAIILNTLATKGYTGVAFIDNTVRQAKIALMKADEVATGKAVAMTQTMIAAQEAHTASLLSQLTVEEQANLVKRLRIATIQQLLTVQQQEYLSNLGITASSQNYEAVATGVLSVEQREALSKTDLTTKSAVYRAALESEVLAKKQSQMASLETMRAEVKSAAAKVETAKMAAISSMQATESARYEVYWAKQSGEVTRIATAEKKLEGAIENQSIARKTALSAQTDFYTKKKQLETVATVQSTIASEADTAAKEEQTIATSFLGAATNKLSLAMKTLWTSMKANPLGWIITLVGLAISAFSMFSYKQKENEENAIGLASATKNATDEFGKQAGKVDALQKILNNSNLAYTDRNKALNDLKQIIPGYNAELTKEGKIINDNTEAIQKYLTQLEKQIKLKAAQDELEKAYKEKRTLEKTETQQSDKYWDVRQTNTLQGYDRNGISAKLSRLIGTESEDNAKKSLDKTRTQLSGVNSTIEELNQEITSTSLSINESSKSAKSYSQQIADTKKQISSLNQELKDLRSGKIKKDNLAGEIDSKIQELNAAKKNLESLTGTKAAKPATEKQTDQLSDKERQSLLKLEEANIEIMEEGYAKRKALQDLQHKKNLAEIDKEERELTEARKAAGKGKLTDKEENSFIERRSLENQSYTKLQNKLFDGEIDYKKQQYQLYWRWVENMGNDVANKRFASLLQDGSSYKDYVEKQMASLNQKKTAGTLTEGEGNQLINLNIQYKEITGAKTAMDLFKESVNQAIGRASTLAEKIQAIADAKEKLAKGSTGLVGADENAQANLFVSEKEKDTNNEVQEKILSDFKTYEERKDAIIKEYQLLRLQKQVQSNQELLSKINKGETDALSSINAEVLMQSQSWKDLFANLDALSVSQIDRLIQDIQKNMNKSDLKLNPVDFQALTDQLNHAKEKIETLNPFKALGLAFDNYKKSLKELKQAEKDGLKDDALTNYKKAVKDAAAQMAQSIASITDMVGTVGNSVASIADSFGAENLSEDIGSVTDIMAGLGQTGGGVAKIMSGDVVGGLKDVVTGIASVITSFNAMHDKKKERQIKALQEQVDALAKSYDSLNDSIDRAYSTDKAGMLEQQNENLEKQNELIHQQIKAEEEKKKTDKDKIKDWEDQIAENNKTIAENTKYSIVEAIMGTDIATAIDNFAEAYAEAWASGEKAASKSANVVNNLIKTAIIDQLKNKLQPEVTAFMAYMSEALADGLISESEQSMLDAYQSKLENISDNYLSQTGSWLKDDSTSSDALTGSVKAISEETGSVVAGRLNGVVINQSDQISVMRQGLIYQQQTAANTGVSASELKEIKDTLKRIENKDSSLLSQGIS